LDDFIRTLARPKHRFEFRQERLVFRKKITLGICSCPDQEPRLGWLKGERSYGAVCYKLLCNGPNFSFGIYRYEAKIGCH